jgi:ubiquinone biosynthesis protein
LTVEYVDGISVLDIITAIHRRDSPFLTALADRGHDLKRIARHIVWNALNQIYRYGYFHADPHPANLIVLPDDAIGYVDFGIVGKLDDETTNALRNFAQSLFAGHTAAAIEEFMRFLTPSARTDVRAARSDLIAAMTDYIESARVGPSISGPTGNIFEVEMLTVVRRHRMALNPDAVRYLKAVLTAEAMAKELDAQFDLRAYENRFFGRLMELEFTEAFDPRRWAQALLETRARVERVLDAIESVRESPQDLFGIVLNVRRRVQAYSALIIMSWLLILAAAWSARGRVTAAILAVAGALVSIGLVAFLIFEVRRLPSESEVGHLSRYPRRLP